MAKGLTILQKRYVDIYFTMKEPNQTQAYIKAGYKARGNTAEVEACKTLKIPKVKAYLNKLREVATKKTEIEGAKVITELGKIAFSNIKRYLDIEGDEVYFKDLSTITDEEAAAIESVKVMKKIIKGKKEGEDDVEIQTIQFKLHSKLNALEQLGRHLGIYEKDNAQSQPKTERTVSPEEMAKVLQDLENAGDGLPKN